MKKVTLAPLPAIPAKPLDAPTIDDSNVWKIDVDPDSIEAYMNSAQADDKTFRELTEGLWDPAESRLHRIASLFSLAA